MFSLLAVTACGPKVDGQGCPDVEVTSACDASLASESACHDQGGCWAVWGLAPSESCNCPTSDAGATCASSADCQGICIVPGSPTSAEGCVTTEGGTCSDFATMYGCFCYVDDEGSLQDICAD
jgi:hypothetical protein